MQLKFPLDYFYGVANIYDRLSTKLTFLSGNLESDAAVHDTLKLTFLSVIPGTREPYPLSFSFFFFFFSFFFSSFEIK